MSFSSEPGVTRRRSAAVLALTVATVIVPSSSTSAEVLAPSGRCVRIESRCFPTLAAALATAADGDTVRLPAGHFAGGVRVTASIRLQGAGPGRTVIAGGGPVLTVGDLDGTTAPTVTIAGVTLQHGVSTTGTFGEPVVGSGGGLRIPPTQQGAAPGATVTVVNSVIRRNLVRPVEQFEFDPEDPNAPQCPDGPCPFAGAFGGGVENWGDLTLRRSTVRDNTAAGALASDSIGGGIFNLGRLTLRHSRVDGNRALGGRSAGRFAEGGGIFSGDATRVTILHSAVRRNVARLTTDLPSALVSDKVVDGTTLDMLANSGGVHVSNDSVVTIKHSRIDRNAASFVGPNAVNGAINAALQVGNGPLVLRDTTVRHNVTRMRMAQSPLAPGGAVQWDGVAHVRRARITENLSSVRTAGDGPATLGAAVTTFAIAVSGGVDPGLSTVRDSVIGNNTSRVVAPRGDVLVFGAGEVNDSSLVLDGVRIAGNRAVGRGATVTLQGGGVWNGPIQDVAPSPPANLTLRDSRVQHNRLLAPDGAVLQGGGIYTEVPLTLRRVRVSLNHPDQCFGCDARSAGSRSAHAGPGRATDRVALALAGRAALTLRGADLARLRA